METTYVIVGLVLWMLGIVTGVYLLTQIERGINKRTTKCKDCTCNESTCKE